MSERPTIEECFAEVEAAVEALESGDLSLDESLRRYEKALQGLREARLHLDEFKVKLTALREKEQLYEGLEELRPDEP